MCGRLFATTITISTTTQEKKATMDTYEVTLVSSRPAVIVNADSVSLGGDDWVKFYVLEEQSRSEPKSKLVHAERAGSVVTIRKLGVAPPESQPPPSEESVASALESSAAELQSLVDRVQSTLGTTSEPDSAQLAEEVSRLQEEVAALRTSSSMPVEFDLEHKWDNSLKFERFTDRARRVAVLATEEARLLNHTYIGTEHILLGLINEGGGVAAKVLESLDISIKSVRQQVEKIIGRGQNAPPGHLPFTPRAKKVLELALREALAIGHNYIGTEHILLGLIREGEGVAAQVLIKLGADLNQVRQQVVSFLSNKKQDKEKLLTENEKTAELNARVRLTTLETRIRELQAKAAEWDAKPHLRPKDEQVIKEILAVLNNGDESELFSAAQQNDVLAQQKTMPPQEQQE